MRNQKKFLLLSIPFSIHTVVKFIFKFQILPTFFILLDAFTETAKSA